MFKRILVPLDGSGRAEQALPIAARIARASGGSIVLVRVVSTEPAQLPSAPARPNLVQSAGEAERQLAETYLEGLTGSDLLREVSVQTEVPVGLVAPSILSVANNKHVDLMVICSHGYTGVTRWWLMGSVAAKLARFAETPVLVLREGGPVPEERHAGDARPLRVIVALDGSQYAQAALVPSAYLAAYLATPGQGALHLTHIVDAAHKSRVPTRTTRTTQQVQADINMSRAYLQSIVSQLLDGTFDSAIAKLNLTVSSSVAIDDDPAQGIINVAENGDDAEGVEVFGGGDVIALTTHGYSGLQQWVGSVAERVLHTSRLPLLVVRPGE
jgi:nucleotide-binding universal stress UspA family protein